MLVTRSLPPLKCSRWPTKVKQTFTIKKVTFIYIASVCIFLNFYSFYHICMYTNQADIK